MNLADAHSRIEQCLGEAQRPAVLCSFGKDSMVMLHLIREHHTPRLPIIFHRDPWFPAKYRFADQVIADWDLEVWDYPPSACSLWEGKEIMAITSHYDVGAKAGPLLMPKNILEPKEGERYLCGLHDFLLRPKARFEYPWDAVFIGHKSSDRDQIAGAVPLRVDVKRNQPDGPDLHFPLAKWTDADVWRYTEEHHIPVQRDRYERREDGTWGECADKTANSDYWPVCIRCCDRREREPEVPCPRRDGALVPNVSDRVNYVPVEAGYFGEREEAAAC